MFSSREFGVWGGFGRNFEDKEPTAPSYYSLPLLYLQRSLLILHKAIIFLNNCTKIITTVPTLTTHPNPHTRNHASVGRFEICFKLKNTAMLAAVSERTSKRMKRWRLYVAEHRRSFPSSLPIFRPRCYFLLHWPQEPCKQSHEQTLLSYDDESILLDFDHAWIDLFNTIIFRDANSAARRAAITASCDLDFNILSNEFLSPRTKWSIKKQQVPNPDSSPYAARHKGMTRFMIGSAVCVCVCVFECFGESNRARSRSPWFSPPFFAASHNARVRLPYSVRILLCIFFSFSILPTKTDCTVHFSSNVLFEILLLFEKRNFFEWVPESTRDQDCRWSTAFQS